MTPATPATPPAVALLTIGTAVMVSFFDGQHQVHNTIAHVLSVGPNDEDTGKPSLSVAFPDPDALNRVFGSPKWHDGYKRETGVQHFSHPRVQAGQESIAWGHPFPENLLDSLIPKPENSASRPYFEREVLPEVQDASVEQAAAVQSGTAPAPTTQSPLVNTPGDAVAPVAAGEAEKAPEVPTPAVEPTEAAPSPAK